MKLAALIALVAAQALAADRYLFTFFRGNGETGVYFALSEDGKKWAELNGGKPWLQPSHSGMLMRDPWLGQGPDGVWHMLWTWGWTSKDTGGMKIGHAWSTDLLHWSEQREIAVMKDEPSARNAWAPEAVWDPGRKEWVIFWATTIPGRFPNTDGGGDSGYNHRIYAITTRDWESFTPARLFFDPGFNCIDATIAQDGKRWVMVFKDERLNPLKKNLRLAFADSPQGPWKDISEPFTDAWNEGPTAAKIGNEWWIYYDHYRSPQHYGAIKTKDWKNFEDVTGQISAIAGQRHGTVVRVPESLAGSLAAVAESGGRTR